TPASPVVPVDRAKELETFEALLKANPTFSEVDRKFGQTIFGYICKGKDDCPANSFCFQQLCRCMLGYRANGGYCEPTSNYCDPSSSIKSCENIAHPGQDCTRSQVCSFNSYCGIFSGVCECPSGMATVNGRCERTSAAPGLACVTSKNCHSSSYCDNGFCLCKTGYQLINNFCLPIPAVETSTISLSMQGNLPDVSMMPRTIQSYPPSPVPLDFTKPPFTFVNNPEVKTVYSNVNPAQASQPTYSAPQMPNFASFPVPFAKGTSTKSGDILAERTKPSPRLKVAMPGDFCGDESICIGNSLCQRQFCRCPPNTFAENGICSIRKRMSPRTKQNHDHEEFIDPSSQEDSSENRQFAAPLENCQNFEFCTGGSECLSIQGMGLVCQCPMNTIFLDDECVDSPRNAELAGIGESCHNEEICLGGSKCIQNICMCDEDKHDIL
ncbi:EB module, partial [Oesophagostomum dentatum]